MYQRGSDEYLATFSNQYAQAIGQNPWLTLFPAFLEKIIPIFQNDTFYIVDTYKNLLPIIESNKPSWRMGRLDIIYAKSS